MRLKVLQVYDPCCLSSTDAKDLSPEIQEFLTTNQIEITRHQVQLELANWTTGTLSQ